MFQGQWEEHQPVKSSPSTLIKRFIHPYLLRAFGFELGRDGWKNVNEASAEGELCPSPRVISHRVCERPSN